MHYRSFGNTQLQVSEIGMGCNRLGEAAQSDEHWINLVHQAVDAGVNLFDTSESYGWGRSEELLGKALEKHPDCLLATKVSRIRETGIKDFSASRIMAQVEGSLRRLRRDCIDIYQLHSPNLEELKGFDWPEAMSRLQQQGKIRFVGVSINDAASGQWLIQQGLVQVLQVPYNMLEPGIGNAIFPLAQQHGIAIMVRTPMAQGILTGKFHPGEAVPPDHRAHLAGNKMIDYIARSEDFRVLATSLDLPMGKMALRYAISHPSVSTTIPGARTVEQLKQNIQASNGIGLPADVLAAIAAIQARWS